MNVRLQSFMVGLGWVLGITLVGTVMPAYAQIGGDTAVTRRPNGNYEASLYTDRTQYSANRAVQITMFLTYLGNIPNTIYTERNREYDFVVREGRTQKAVFTLSKHREPIRPVSISMRPGETRTYRELWDQRDDNGKPLPRGVYVIKARIHPQQAVTTQIFLSDRDGNPRPLPGKPENPGNPNPGKPENPRPGYPGLPGGGNPPSKDSFASSLRASDTRVRPGQEVTLTYNVKNNSKAQFIYVFSSGKQFDMNATAPNGQIVWTDSRDKVYAMALTQLSFQPGETRTFTTKWVVPENARPGAYRLMAFLTPSSQNLGQVPAAVTVMVSNEGGGGNPGSPQEVSLREVVNSGAPMVGQRVTVSGVYIGLKGGYGSPPVSRSDWVLAGDGVTCYINGNTPALSLGSTVTVTGTIRRTSDGRIYLQRD